MIAKNNIFNIRSGQSWQGMTGVTKGFCEFQSVDYCIRAWLILMRTYRRKYFLLTPRSIINRFAPPSENDTSHYVDFVCSHMHIDPDFAIVSDSLYYVLACWMARMETSYQLHLYEVKNVAQRFNISIVPKVR